MLFLIYIEYVVYISFYVKIIRITNFIQQQYLRPHVLRHSARVENYLTWLARKLPCPNWSLPRTFLNRSNCFALREVGGANAPLFFALIPNFVRYVLLDSGCFFILLLLSAFPKPGPKTNEGALWKVSVCTFCPSLFAAVVDLFCECSRRSLVFGNVYWSICCLRLSPLSGAVFGLVCFCILSSRPGPNLDVFTELYVESKMVPFFPPNRKYLAVPSV